MNIEEEMLIDNVITKTEKREKKSSLQFLPECLLDLSKNKNFIYKAQKLKSSYIIDIVHNSLLKYYFKKENKFTLSAIILKSKYGYLYNYYIDYLKDSGILTLKKNYLKGRNCRIYSFNESILTSKILRFNNQDRVLIKKYVQKHLKYELERHGIIEQDIKIKMIQDLYSVGIQFDRAMCYLDTLKNEDLDIYNRNKYSIESINKQHIFYHFDTYGRMHTNFTILKSFIRKNCLLIDGEETCEIDIKNSQPLFLSKLIERSSTRWVKHDEFELFSTLVKAGNYYQFLVDKLNLDSKLSAKKLTYKVFFGQNREKSKIDSMFISLFPTIHNFIKLYKTEHKDYKVLAHDLQKAESNLVFNKIIKRIMITKPQIQIITVHDSIIVKKRYRNFVSDIFFGEIFSHFETSSPNQ